MLEATLGLTNKLQMFLLTGMRKAHHLATKQQQQQQRPLLLLLLFSR